MTTEQAATVLAGALVGYGVARPLARLRLKAPPSWSVRTNVRGVGVPAVLGGPVVAGALVALACASLAGALGWRSAQMGALAPATVLVLVVMYLAGSWDDRRGDEGDRGFGGHLRAARGGRLTGGVVKLLAGGAAGVGAGALLSATSAVVTGIVAALAANLINLTDRAPGRAGKIVLIIALPLMWAGDPSWAVASSGVVGSLVGCLSLDLGERGMLGDAGANPLGAVLGLGLATSLHGVWLACAVVILAALNLASERWSFSRGIARNRWLDMMDRLGRK